MRSELNDQDLEKVVGGTVLLNTTKMKIGFTVHGQAFYLQNCTDVEAMSLVVNLYGQYQTSGDYVFEEKTLEAFRANGWIKEW